MPGQRSKDKSHFTAATEKELKEAIEEYAKTIGLDRNTALRALLWKQTEQEGIAKTPEKFFEEVEETKKKLADKTKAKKKK